MNFISTFEELSKLYESKDVKVEEKVIDEACNKEELTEATEDEEIEIVDDEAPMDIVVDEPVEEQEPIQFVLECSKCGALVVKPEADTTVDEETDLVNMEDECQFCEEAKGYKIIGTLVPYEVTEAIEAEEEVAEEEAPVEDEVVEEDLGDLYRKTFDKPASSDLQQSWEDELNGEMGEISPARRAELEKKFAQQRDWEARHAVKEEMAEDKEEDELEELLDISVPVSVNANGNDVAVGGMA
jgi:hypothetical protein